MGQDFKIKLNPRQTIKSNNIVTQFFVKKKKTL